MSASTRKKPSTIEIRGAIDSFDGVEQREGRSDSNSRELELGEQ